MQKSDVSFSWPTPPAGFEWREGEWVAGHQTEQWLLVEAEARAYGRRVTRPLADSPALFRSFAELLPTRDDIVAFANEHGGLGVGSHFLSSSGAPELQAYGVVGEPLTKWLSEIGLMKEAVTLLDLVQGRNVAGLAQLFRWRDGDETGPEGWIYHGSVQAARVFGGIGPSLPTDVVTPAVTLLSQWCNSKLRNQTSLQLVFDQQNGRPVLAAVPNTLLTALWVQLADAIAHPVQHRRCKTCNRWFVISDDGRKADQVFCQDSCKSKDYRLRQARARELAGEGKSVKQIAEVVETDIGTVKKWLGKKK
jgi:hypothetical protein